ncbi:MAG: polysaccharide deacetylase family protein, partial [Candidatus Saganbacteria bacterium]|nr:polysaccharide deacetylase family protein [Candidatus Saganbacteria bacterium]
LSALICCLLANPVLAKENGVIQSGNLARQVVALTFDDGPKPEFSQRILNILDLYGIKATFFVVGKEAREQPDEVYRMYDSGQEIGSHTYSHASLMGLSEKEIKIEIEKLDGLIYEITGQRPKYFRPPGGAYDGRILGIVKDHGMSLVLWDLNSSDYDSESEEFEIDKDYDALAKELADRVIKKAKNGSIILLHNGSSQTIKALPAIIEGLRAGGFAFVTISELLNPGESW